MAIAFNTENYDALNASISELLKAGNYALINVYTDAAGTVFEKDVRGNIENREVMSVSFTAAHKDKDGNTVNPYLIVTFKDGNLFVDEFKSVDYIDDHWYKLVGRKVPTKTFLSAI